MKFLYKTAVRGIYLYAIVSTAGAEVVIQADNGKFYCYWH